MEEEVIEKKVRKKRRVFPKKVIHKKKILQYIRREPKYDYLKYKRIVIKWAILKYDISESDLDMLFFLYSEGLFNYYKFVEYANIFGWDKTRFHRIKEKGYVHIWDKNYYKTGSYNQYELTRKARLMITKIYKVLNGEETVSELPINNPMFRRERFSHKVNAMTLKTMNKEIRERRIKRENPDY
jgi:hypothetical protein